MIPALALLLACPPTVELDSGGLTTPTGTTTPTTSTTTPTGTTPTGTTTTTSTGTTTAPPPGDDTTAILATVSADYSVGALATVDLGSWAVVDERSAVSGDPAVSVEGDWLVQINRYGYDTVRLYDLESWSAPVREWSTGDGSNPYAASLCEDRLFVALFEGNVLPAYDPDTGLLVGAVDLAPWADADGSPEPASLARVGGKLYVGLEMYDRSDWSWPHLGGAVLEVDCAALTVTRSWTVGSGARVVAWPGRDDVLVLTGKGFGKRGGIYQLDSDSGALSGNQVDTDALGVEYTGLAVHGLHAVALASTPDYATELHCVDLDAGTASVAEPAGPFLTAIAGNDLGEAWVAARPPWTDPTSPGGMIVYDIATCTSLTGPSWIDTVLDPYDVAFR